MGFFFNATTTTEIYTLSLHDALPISGHVAERIDYDEFGNVLADSAPGFQPLDRKSTRLNSSHVSISYAVFCLKKKKAINKGFQSSLTHNGASSEAENSHGVAHGS